MSENKDIKNKISIWECGCPMCGNVETFEWPQGVIPKYCSRCGSEADYHEVAGYEVADNKKNTPKGVYVGKCPKCNYENRREITQFHIDNGLSKFGPICGTRTNYQKHLTVEPLKNSDAFDKVAETICATIRDTLSK